MNTKKFIIFIIIGIILFFLLNKSEGFNIGVPWIIVSDSNGNPGIWDYNIEKLSGEPFECEVNAMGEFEGDSEEETCYKSFSEVSRKSIIMKDVIEEQKRFNPVVYHIIPDTELNQYRVDIEKCIDPYVKIMGTPEELTGENEWKMKTKENNETKPLIPRKNLMREDEYYDTTELYYDIGDQIAFSCDTRKTQSKTPHSLVCKPRKKFVVQAHGGVSTEKYNTRIPQLFQVMLYKTDTNECIRSNIFGSNLRRQAILKYDNSATDYNDVKIQGNKLYLASIEEATEYPQEIIEELVYSELSQLNSGHLYLNCNTSIMRVSFSDILYFKIGDYMYCFYTDETLDDEEINNAEQIRANLVNFLNPFMLYGVFLLDNDDTSNTLDKLNLEDFDGSLESEPNSNRFFSRRIYPNGVNLAGLNITEDESARRTFEYPYSVSLPWNLGIDDVEKTTEMATMATAMQNQKYPAGLSVGVPGEQPYQGFQDSDRNHKPVYFRKFRVDYPETLVDEITRQVRSLLLSCCVEIDPNLLRERFIRNEAFNRLFPNGLTRTRRFPLLYFDIYTIDGFVNNNNSDYRLDDQGGNYTSEDMRLLVKEIIRQIYRGSKNDGVIDVRNLGYYQMFKTKMMLEKGYNEAQCRVELNRLYGQWRQIPPTFNQTSFNYILKNRFLCVDLLQQVWGNYGYDYNTDTRPLYGFSADVPIIFAKLFKTVDGEAADVHIMCCIRNETTNIRSIQKKGYWGCVDTPGYSEYTGPNTPRNTCEWYKTNSIARCNAHGHRGANDNCCICKMVKNMNEEGPINERPNVGPNCKVRECKQTLEDKNRELSGKQPPMGIPLNNIYMGGTGEMEGDYWEQNNIQTGEMEGPSTIHPDNNNRIMEHTETAFKYVSDTDDQEYGTLQLITEDGNEEGVLKQTPPITVLCNYRQSEIDDHEDDSLFSTYENQMHDVAGQIRCIIPGGPDTDEAFYDDNLRCPIPNACASVSINAEYFPLPSLEGIEEAMPPVLIGSGNGG